MWKILGIQSIHNYQRQISSIPKPERRPFNPKTVKPQERKSPLTKSGIFTERIKQRLSTSREKSINPPQSSKSGAKLVSYAKVLTKTDQTVILDDQIYDKRVKTQYTDSKQSFVTNKVQKIKRRSSILKTANMCKSYIDDDSQLIFGGKPAQKQKNDHPLFGLQAAVHCSGASSIQEYDNKVSRGVQSEIYQTKQEKLQANKSLPFNIKYDENKYQILRCQVLKLSNQFYTGMSLLENKKKTILSQYNR